jgi:hypothetical protein
LLQRRAQRTKVFLVLFLQKKNRLLSGLSFSACDDVAAVLNGGADQGLVGVDKDGLRQGESPAERSSILYSDLHSVASLVSWHVVVYF